MKKLILCAAVLFSSQTFASGGHHWGYEGESGPANWAQLSSEYGACAGKNQSPIDLQGFIEAELQPLEIAYHTGGNEILNNGHTVQINYKKGSSINIDKNTFNLLQFHFHAPSENMIKGVSYPMEAHLVHADKNGNLAVVAVMIEEGASNPVLEKAWKQLPEHAGDKSALTAAVDVNNTLPENKDYYRFNGSLTTPPCTEGVRWFVMKDTVTASKAQIEAFKKVMHHPNNRPVQSVNARPVLQ